MPPSGSEPPSSEAQTRRRAERMETGSVLGRYTIEGAIGEGGMGVVYRARDARLGRKVALKVLYTSEDDPESVERTKRFLREARAAAALDHPNAVSIFDVGEAGELSFIAMELVNGQSLRTYVAGTGGVREFEPDVPLRLRWLVDIASALAAAHQAGMIHRDVKPENVMIRDDGRVKVLDFGLARRTAQRPAQRPAPREAATVPRIDHDTTFTETGQTTLTAVGTLLGTPQYMAPEQIRSEPLDARGDQFSWGILAYELLTGELPWKGVGIHVMARILIDEPTPIGDLNPAVPDEAVAVVMRALARPPDERFPSMDELIAALDPYADPASRSDPRALRSRSFAPRPIPTVRPAPEPKPFVDNSTQRSADHVPPQVGPPAAAAAPRKAGSPRSPKTSRSPRVEVVDAPSPARGRGAMLGVAAIALALGGLLTWKALHAWAPAPSTLASAAVTDDAGDTARDAETTGGHAAGHAGGAATAVTNLPDPRTASPDALAAYRAGLAELRFGGTRDPLERATVLDPSLAAAHLQLAVDATEYELDDTGRAHLRKAVELRAQLGERDQLLLDALEPVLLRQPADWAEAGRRLATATSRFPRDAQLWYERGAFAQASDGPDVSERYVERAIALDPRYGQAMSLMAQDLAYLGRFAEARTVLARCAEVAPSYVTCPQELARILEHEGACDEEEALARQLVTASTHQDVAQGLLAGALAARGRPEAAVREALKLKWAALDAPERRRVEPVDTLGLDLLSGDFAAAERGARALEAAAEPSRREADHGRAARLLAQIYTETGRTADAGRTAEAFLGRHDAWERDPRSEDFALADDATPDLLAAALRGGKLTRADVASKRAEWLHLWEGKAPPAYRHYLWAHGFAAMVDTVEDARAALAALPAYEPLPGYYPKTVAEAAVGHALLLGGRADDALPWLERAAKTCRALELPVEHTRAHLWLGMAREAKGDKAGACAAYRVVQARWGKAKPPSVTAEKAAERLRALACVATEGSAPR